MCIPLELGGMFYNIRKIEFFNIILFFRSLDGGNEQQALDLKRQLTLMESEASVLRSRAQQLESENDKILAENKKLQLSRGIVKSSPADKEKITSLQEQLTEANNKVFIK